MRSENVNLPASSSSSVSLTTKPISAEVAAASNFSLLIDLSIEVGLAAAESERNSPNHAALIERALRIYEDPLRQSPSVHPRNIPDGNYQMAPARERAKVRAFVLGHLINQCLCSRGGEFGDAEFGLMLGWQNEPQRIVKAAALRKRMNAAALAVALE